MGLKRTDKTSTGNGTASAEPAKDTPQLRDNPEVNARIDDYIKANPKEWTYIQGLPQDRLERSLVLQYVNKTERRERVRTAVLKKLEDNSELKEAYRTLVKNLPAEQQEKAMASIAMQTQRTIAPKQQQTAGVKV